MCRCEATYLSELCGIERSGKEMRAKANCKEANHMLQTAAQLYATRS